MTRLHNLAAILAAVAGTALSQTAWAQDLDGTPSERPDPNQDRIVLGLGIAHVPTYQGSRDYRTIPIPAIDLSIGQVYANLRNGVGVEVVQTRAFTFGGGIAPMPGYRRRDVPDGVGSPSFGAGGRLFANLRAGGLLLTVGGTRGFVGSTKGFIADASASYPIATSRRLTVIPSVGVSLADTRHTDRYFGISATEALASGLPAYAADGGLKDVSASLTANYRLTGRLNLTAMGGLTTLVGDARHSPLVERKTQPTGFLSLSYRFAP